jgi:4-amino-4-deoxy-L-arabinose transferase-like glycosyltransferase
MPRRLFLPLALVLALAPYFLDLGRSSIWDANEAFYVETPREMMERGDYIYPMFNYEPRVNKPVLSYWIVAGFYRVFGVSVGVQRVPIAIGAMALIAAAFFLARAASPSGVGREAGLWAALGLAISPRLVMFARRIFIDVYISMFMALTLLFFALSERYPERRRLFLALMYVAIGLGMLTKGPVAAVLPAMVFAAYLLVHRELGRVREMMIPLGVAVAAIIVVPWYAALYRYAGWEPIKSFIFGENVARYVEGIGVNQERGPFFYVPIVFSDAFPWSLLLIAAAVWWIRERRRDAKSPTPTSRVQTLLWLWILVIVGFFSLSAGKQDLYVFPIVPAVVALGGMMIALATETGKSAATIPVRLSTFVIATVIAVAGAGVLALFQSSNAVYVLAGTAFIGGAAIVGGALAMLLAARRQLVGALASIAVVLIVINWVFVLRLLPSFEVYKPAPDFAEVLKARARPEDGIVTYNVALPSLVYYLRRHTDVFYDPGPVFEMLESHRRIFLMLPSHDFNEIIKPVLKVPTCLVATQPTFDVKLRNVMSRQQLPELWMISNRCDQ